MNLRRSLLGLWLLLGVVLLLMLVAQRHSEAKGVAEANAAARDLAGRVRHEALRKPRERLHELADRGDVETAFTAEALVERARPLAAAGFVIMVEHPRAGLVPAAPVPASVPRAGRSVLTIDKVRYFARAGPNKFPGDAFLFPASYQDKLAIGKVLGIRYPTAIHAAMLVDKQSLQHAARDVLSPGLELAVYHADMRQVNMIRGEGAALDVDTAREPVPGDVLRADASAADLSRTMGWPRFLLMGGNELGGVEFLMEERHGRSYRVVYLRDFQGGSDSWNGLAMAYPHAGSPRSDWPASHVLAGLLAYLLLPAMLLLATKPGKKKD